ncbi:MAG: hypothetical protein MUE70_01180 [Desulfobacterales bacterium]|nr:hypothetical protein [Desulfobacterales bacterium]
MNQFKIRTMLVVLFCSMFFSGLAFADDVTDAINEALQYYQDGKYSDAMTSLNYASQLIGQKKGGDLQSFLPQPLAGWEAEEATSQSVGAAMLGGGVSAERQYNKGSGSVRIQIVTDSPMLQSMMMMFGNPMLAGADGGKLEKIAGEKAIVKYNAADKSGDIKLVVANRFLVTLDGNDVSLEDLKAYAAKIDYKKLAAMQ